MEPIIKDGGSICYSIGSIGDTFEEKEFIVGAKRKQKSRGQSIVEFTILLPLLLMLLSSLIEFGFALNEYLDLIDTTREAARWLSDQDPFLPDSTNYKEAFYLGGQVEMERTLGRAGWIILDPAVDDLVISVFAITDLSPPQVTARYPTSSDFPAGDSRADCGGAANGGVIGWRLYCARDSGFLKSEIDSRIGSITSAPNTGVVLVEIFYDYHMKLGLPWVTGIVGDTITFHAYSFAPNAASEP